ncbi:MAG: imidazolonepropionase [Deltaproteobacteria bacterium]|nr:imidazolonepropionase [Deltaproteobacteria bacterium]
MNTDHFVLYENIKQCVTLAGVAKNSGRHPKEADLGVISDAAVVVNNQTNRIEWIGKNAELPTEFGDLAARFSCEEEVWLPELIECHTHLIYAGTRHHDFALRCLGKTYQQIASEGGGILSTLTHTRKASPGELLESASSELEHFQKYGVGTIEIKSGYGLSLESELRILKCIQELQHHTSVLLAPTFMPAHATPPEFKGQTDEYVKLICKEWIPEVAKNKLAVFFDAFVEEGYFSVEQARTMCEAALASGLKLKLHVDQFTNLGGASLAVDMGAISCDHLDNVGRESIQKLAESKTVAVLLPGASLFTGTPYPPARNLIDAGAIVALSTDYNPGTCPTRNLPLMTTIACCQMGMTIAESIAGITYNAAAALGLQKELGSLEMGKNFRVCQLKADSYEVLPYCFGELE